MFLIAVFEVRMDRERLTLKIFKTNLKNAKRV